jgi:glutamate synthase (NADPH/NADH) small chain
LEGIHFALAYLTQQNRIVSGEAKPLREGGISARDKVVVVIGGGDTGSDCVGTANRDGAKEVRQFEILPKPPEHPPADTPWPTWPRVLRTTTSHEEGCQRRWNVMTKSFAGRDGRVAALTACEVEWVKGSGGGWESREVPGSEFTVQADLVLLAMGFVHVVHGGLVKSLGLELDKRGNVVTDADRMTSCEGVFAAGDTVEGASLIVRAIYAGRQAAAGVDRWLARKG